MNKLNFDFTYSSLQRAYKGPLDAPTPHFRNSEPISILQDYSLLQHQIPSILTTNQPNLHLQYILAQFFDVIAIHLGCFHTAFRSVEHSNGTQVQAKTTGPGPC